MLTVSGLVASERDYGEQDRFISIITAEHGIIDLLVKGAKKITGRNNSSTGLFSYSKFCIRERNGRRYLDSSEPIYVFYGLRLDLKKLALACYIAEAATYSLTIDNKNGGEIMKLILNSLYLLESDKRTPEFIKSAFEFRFAVELGFLPALIGCNECYIHNAPEMYFLADQGILLCEEHFQLQPQKPGVRLTSGVLHAVRHICLLPVNKIFSFKISESSQKILSVISQKYLLFHLAPPHIFKTLSYYHEVN